MFHSSFARRLAASFIVCGACVIAGGCNDQQRVPRLDLTGHWKSEIDESVMSIEPSGLFAMDVPCERLPIIGTVAIDGTQATFRNRPETRLCVGDDGIYEIEIVEDLMISRLVRDTCPSRVLHMSRLWRRLNASSMPPTSP